MTNYGSGDVGLFLVGGRSILGDLVSLDVEVQSLTEKTTPLGSAWKTSLATGIRTANMAQEGFFNPDAGASNEALDELQQTSQVVILSREPNAIGNRFLGMEGAFGSSYKASVLGQEALIRAAATYTVSGKVDDGNSHDAPGHILHALGAESGATFNTESSSVDGTASSSNGGTGYFATSALTLGGYTSVTLTVRDSPNDSTWGDLVSSAVVTASPNAQRVEVSGTVERYLASSGTFNGSGSSQSVTCFIGFVRNE